MAYGEKYFHTYCDIYGNEYRVSLREIDYSGATAEVECGYVQWETETENSYMIKIGGVYPTKATSVFKSKSGFDLQELYTGQENTHQLVRLKNGVLDWIGFVIPDGFNEDNWDDEHPYLTVEASDNLPALKGVPFVDELGENYGAADGHMKSFLWVIKEALKKTGSLLPIWTMVDIKPSVQSESRVFQVRAAINISTNVVTILDYTKSIKDFIQTGYHTIIEGHEFNVSSFSVVPSVNFDAIHINPDTTLTGNTFNGNTEIEFSEPQSAVEIADPLRTEHDVRVWIRDSNIQGKSYYEARGGAMMSWEVLDAIGRQFNVKIQQNQGHWEIKRWNADKIETGIYQWYKYNSEGIETGREPFGLDVVIPCLPSASAKRIYGTKVSMDRVLKNVIVNYRYKYKQEGDSLQNLIVNGNFEGSFNPNPKAWDRVHADRLVVVPFMVVTKETTDLPTDFANAVRIENYANTRTIHNLTVLSNPLVNKGDRLKIQWYERVDGVTGSNLNDAYCGIYALSVWGDRDSALGINNGVRSGGKIYDMVNNGQLVTGQQPPSPYPLKTVYTARWRDQDEDEGQKKHFRFHTPYVLGSGMGQYGRWRLVEVEVDEVPMDGILKFEILGAATNRHTPLIGQGQTISNPERVSPSPVYAPAGSGTGDILTGSYEQALRTYFPPSQHVTMVVTGVFIGKMVDPDNEAVPQIDPFMYPDYQAQLSRRYTDTIDEIEVLTGDDYGEYANDKISGMWWGGKRTSMWDTWDNRYGWSRQGLVTAKSVAEMYWKPTRLIDCEIRIPNIHWSSRIQFEELPGLRFVLLRGTIGGKDESFKGTLTEIHDDAAPGIPPGGNDGGNTTDPNWQPTGVSRCVIDEGGLNTGDVEIVEIDVNPASTTFNQERWVMSEEDIDRCPIGEPVDLYWGASTLPIDPATLDFFPYEKDEEDYLVRFDNDGTGKYLVFLHRASLGTVNSIRYLNGGWQAYGNLPSWQYEADTTINGYTYKVMRQIYMSGTLNQLPLIFTIQ